MNCVDDCNSVLFSNDIYMLQVGFELLLKCFSVLHFILSVFPVVSLCDGWRFDLVCSLSSQVVWGFVGVFGNFEMDNTMSL